MRSCGIHHPLRNSQFFTILPPCPALQNAHKAVLRISSRVYASAEQPEEKDDQLPPQPSPISIEPAALVEEGHLEDGWATAKTLTQLWAIVLPLGYAVLPLTAQALADVPGGQAIAAAGVEAAVLVGVIILLRQKKYTFNFTFRKPTDILLGLSAGCLALAINQLLFVAGGPIEATGEVAAVVAASGPFATIALFIASALLAPTTEELIYRGFFLSSLMRLGLPAPAAVLVSALTFAAAHLQPDAVPQLTVVGVALGAAAVKARWNLVAPLVGHSVYNGALFLSILVSSS